MFLVNFFTLENHWKLDILFYLGWLFYPERSITLLFPVLFIDFFFFLYLSLFVMTQFFFSLSFPKVFFFVFVFKDFLKFSLSKLTCILLSYLDSFYFAVELIV